MTDYTIQDLSDQTGVPRRTIHFYSQQGILPPPAGAGLSARYQEPHLVRLKLSPFLRQRGLRLDEIRRIFEESQPAALAEMLSREEQASALPAPAPTLKGAGATLESAGAISTPAPARIAPAAQEVLHAVHYSLPFGMTLIVPQELERRQPGLVARILNAIYQAVRNPQENV